MGPSTAAPESGTIATDDSELVTEDVWDELDDEVMVLPDRESSLLSHPVTVNSSATALHTQARATRVEFGKTFCIKKSLVGILVNNVVIASRQ